MFMGVTRFSTVSFSSGVSGAWGVDGGVDSGSARTVNNLTISLLFSLVSRIVSLVSVTTLSRWLPATVTQGAASCRIGIHRVKGGKT